MCVCVWNSMLNSQLLLWNSIRHIKLKNIEFNEETSETNGFSIIFLAFFSLGFDYTPIQLKEEKRVIVANEISKQQQQHRSEKKCGKLQRIIHI